MAYSIMRRELRQPDGAWLIHYMCDADADIANVPAEGLPGSDTLVIATGEKYYLDTTGNWAKPTVPTT